MENIIPQSTSPFFTLLPLEIRRTIYNHAYSSPLYATPDLFASTKNPEMLYLTKYGRPRRDLAYIPSSLFTCKQFYTEACDIAYSTVSIWTVWSAHSPRIGVASYGRWDGGRKKRLEVVIRMRDEEWSSWLGFVRDFMKGLEALREIVVEWHPRPPKANEKQKKVSWDKLRGDSIEWMIGLLCREGIEKVVVKAPIEPDWVKELRKRHKGMVVWDDSWFELWRSVSAWHSRD